MSSAVLLFDGSRGVCALKVRVHLIYIYLYYIYSIYYTRYIYTLYNIRLFT